MFIFVWFTKYPLLLQDKCLELLDRIDEINSSYLSQKEHLELQLLKDDLLVFVQGYRWSG